MSDECASDLASLCVATSTSSSDGQFFRSAKRGDAAGEVNARHGHDPGFSQRPDTSPFLPGYSSRGLIRFTCNNEIMKT
jgi:hypothetical protein